PAVTFALAPTVSFPSPSWGSFDRSINVQILVAGDFAFHMQGRSEPRCRSVRCRSRWTHHVFVHLGCSPQDSGADFGGWFVCIFFGSGCAPFSVSGFLLS